MKGIIGVVGYGKTSLASTLKQQIEYDENKNNLYILVPDIANRLITIIEIESFDTERRTAFLSTTIEEIRKGADYSKCDNIKDMSNVYAENLVRRLMG